MRSNIHNASQAVAELRASLLSSSQAPSPESLAAHLPALEAAVRDLEALRADPSLAAGIVPRKEIEFFALDLLGVARLIEHGMNFNQGWARMLASAAHYQPGAADYQANGEPSPVEPAGKVSIKG
jgi:hypothetical protein